MSASHDTETAPVTRPSTLGPSAATRVVAVVVSALVWGALVYVSRFTPHVFGIQPIYPAPAVAPAFGLWFGVWGAIGQILGTTVSQLPAGLSPLVWIPSNLAQGLFALLPALLYRHLTVDGWQRWLRYAGVCVLTVLLVELVVTWNLSLNGLVPFAIGLRTVFPLNSVVAALWMLLIGPVVLHTVSPYVVKAGLRLGHLV
ncbi:MAG TPA: hypothetical protein VFA92_15035 [Candidatus Binatia bacterium]|jgi:hypothetical protein|nr:hypothetical protein [Candidatus Binatia bacterium]